VTMGSCAAAGPAKASTPTTRPTTPTRSRIDP
jgi:hypothetical protein